MSPRAARGGGSGRSRNSGYSGTPLAKKLGVKEESILLLVDAPGGWRFPDLPAGVDLRRRQRLSPKSRDVAEADVVVAFFETAAELSSRAHGIARRLAPASALWTAWPRRAGGHESDITDQLIRETLLPEGVVDVKVAAIDEDWSGLKFVVRRENRPEKAR